MIDRIQLVRNIGQFDNISPSQQTNFSKLSVVYAENGRGKTTLANILRSLGTNNPKLIEERHRLGASHPPHIVIQSNSATFTYQNGVWQNHLPEIAVFDDNFVAQNVCSGIEVDSGHRQNLHKLIIGAQGIALNNTLQIEVQKIEEHNRKIKEKEAAIPAAIRGTLTVDEFCALQKKDDIDSSIEETQKNIEAAKASDTIKQAQIFQTVALPEIDVNSIESVLQQDLPSLQKEAATMVQRHLSKFGKDAESWVGDGVAKIELASSGEQDNICPFCAQELKNSPLIIHYQGYFSQSYSDLKQSIIMLEKALANGHSADVQTAFERSIQTVKQSASFWQKFMDISLEEIDTIEVARSWKAAREPILDILRKKAAAPLEKMALTPEMLAAVDAYNNYREKVSKFSEKLNAYNLQISTVKEKAASANLSTLNSDMANLKLIKTRFLPENVKLCNEYIQEKNAKETTEKNRSSAKLALDTYQTSIFSTYESAINKYLEKFLAGFRLYGMTSQNTRAGTSCTYKVLINTVSVPISADSGHSFKNTLSAGDRNTLALAFFFASLEKGPSLAQKIVVIDDPITSLDDHRISRTIEQIIDLSQKVKQVIVLSHSKQFLCQLWSDAERVIKSTLRTSMQIIRSGASSIIESWDVNQDCITEHDKRHALIASYLDRSDPNKQRDVARALRPTLEAFLRVAYPAFFPPSTLLGAFIQQCTQSLAKGNVVLAQADIEELEQLTNYANKFHHDSNPAYVTEIINDQTLLDYCQRTLRFARRA
ncbi:MAG: AAA family ATPase [Caedimonas sp.]|nr:AAA family ATPase [Caedimonas sp.]